MPRFDHRFSSSLRIQRSPFDIDSPHFIPQFNAAVQEISRRGNTYVVDRNVYAAEGINGGLSYLFGIFCTVYISTDSLRLTSSGLEILYTDLNLA